MSEIEYILTGGTENQRRESAEEGAPPLAVDGDRESGSGETERAGAGIQSSAHRARRFERIGRDGSSVSYRAWPTTQRQKKQTE